MSFAHRLMPNTIQGRNALFVLTVFSCQDLKLVNETMVTVLRCKKVEVDYLYNSETNRP